MIDESLYTDTWDAAVKEDVLKLSGPILVIGASGFVGAKLFFSLTRLRNDVYAASSAIEHSWRLLQYPGRRPDQLINLDITDPRQITEVIQRIRPRTVFNLSAYGAYERQSQVAKIHNVNYVGVVNLVSALQEAGCDAFVQAGSSSEYGLNCAGPLEGAEPQPNSDYAVSKGGASLHLKYMGRIKQFPCANLRLYSVYGPWEDRGRLIPRLVENVLNGDYPPFADPDISRDFIYIDDCNHAFVRAAITVCRTDPGISVNVATGTKTSLAQVAAVSHELFKIQKEPQFGSMANRKWDLSNWYGDPSLAGQKMGWKAKTSFADGLRLTAEWERKARSVINFGYLPTKQKRVSAIIACYRDHQAIPVMYERLTRMFRAQQVDYEIIFVNDCSPTQDGEVIRELSRKDSCVIGISHSRNFGSQSAFMSGMEIATGDAVVLMDGDLQDPPEVIPDFIKKWEEGYEVVYGQRIKREAPLHMQILYKVFYRIFRKLSDIQIPVDAGDFSLIDRRALNHLLKFPERDQFIRGLRAWVGFKQVGAPYLRPERMFGVTTNSFLKNIWWAKKAIFSFSTKPLNYIQGLGVGLFGLSLLVILFVIVNFLLNPHQNPRGTNTIIILVLGLGGIQLFAVSLLGDYVGKILEEVKLRPKFIRAAFMSGGDWVTRPEDMERFMELRRANR